MVTAAGVKGIVRHLTLKTLGHFIFRLKPKFIRKIK